MTFEKYAALIVDYCVEVQPGDKVYIRTTTAAEPLVKEIYKKAYQAGATHVEMDISFQFQSDWFLNYGSEEAMKFVSPKTKAVFEEYDCLISIMAPFEMYSSQKINGENAKLRSTAMAPINELYYSRTATRSMKRTLCQFPTLAAAQQAQMSLDAYTEFVFKCCKLDQPSPKDAWLETRAFQQKIVNYLNKCEKIQYLASHTDITFSTKGRTWINSDGQTNMPSGEVYTSPVEDSVNGHIHFTLPGNYMKQRVENVTLHVKDGYIESWEATKGKDFLDKIFLDHEGTRRFGEAAIGTNPNIQQMTNNILFDEKMGGTVHMAIGQSYKQCGGKNTSSVHWDMITDMTTDGKIFADGVLIYEKGKFLEVVMGS